MQAELLEALFPAGVVAVSAESASLWEAPLHPAEAGEISHAAPGRQREFAVGRACAREALARLGLRAGAIARTPQRAPAWPPGAIGSITHCAGYCAAAVARRGEILGLGLDAERAGRVTQPILERVTTPAELRSLMQATAGRGFLDWPTLVWCAKESVLKCLAGVTGRMPAPREIAIELSPERFLARLLSPELGALGVGELRGSTACRGSLVLAGVAFPAPGGPVADGALP